MIRRGRSKQRTVLIGLCASLLLGQLAPGFAGALTDGQQAVVEQWEWDDPEWLLAGDAAGGYTLAVAGDYTEETPLTRDELAAALPETITAWVMQPEDAPEDTPEAVSPPADAPEDVPEDMPVDVPPPAADPEGTLDPEGTSDPETAPDPEGDPAPDISPEMPDPAGDPDPVGDPEGTPDPETAPDPEGDPAPDISPEMPAPAGDPDPVGDPEAAPDPETASDPETDAPLLRATTFATETLAIRWDLGAIPAAGVYEGSYPLTARLPSGYVLGEDAPPLAVTLVLDTPTAQKISLDVLKANQIETATPLNTKVDLFDYWVHESAEANDWIQKRDNVLINNNEGLPDNEKIYQGPDGLYYQSGINKDRPLLVGNGMGRDEAQKYHHGLWNTTANSWWRSNQSWLDGIVQNRLGADGMPQINMENVTVGKDKNLSERVYNAWVDNGQDPSLGYFFDPKVDVENGRAVYENVRGLFTLENGNYSYSCHNNYAEFIEDDSVEGSDGYFNVYNTWAVQNGTHEGGNFAPFNTAQQLLTENGMGGLKDAGLACTQNQSYYRPNATSKGTDASNTTINHYLGMVLETSFVQPEDGFVDTDKQDRMVFSFTGDNDVWIFIDDVLVGDLGGLHSESFIGIDFSTGYIYRGPVKKTGEIPTVAEVEELFQAQGNNAEETTVRFPNNTSGDFVTVNGVDYAVRPGGQAVFSRSTLCYMHEQANDDTQTWGNGTHGRPFTYADDTIHTLKFFYLERGGWDTNLSLNFNLISVPHSAITKVSQDGAPVVGAEFALYAANYDPDTQTSTIRDGEPICTAVTDEDGSVMLVDDKRRIVQFDELATQQGIKDYILQETKTPPGYRSRQSVALYYDSGGLVLTRDPFRSGAYTTGMQHVTMGNTLKSLTDPDKTWTYQGKEPLDGTIFAVPLKLDSDQKTFERDKSMFDKLHPVIGGMQKGWRIMAEGANVNVPEDKAAIVAAAKSYHVQAKKNTRNVYAMTLEDIPGAIDEQYWYCKQKGKLLDDEENYVRDHARYFIGFFYAPRVRSVEDLTVDSEIHMLDDKGDEGFEQSYTSRLNIPNTFNRFHVQKMNYHGVPAAGAKFGLYQVYSSRDRDGDGDQYLPVQIFGQRWYINTQMFNLSDADLQAIKADPNTDPVQKLHAERKSFDELLADYQKGAGRTIEPWDVSETQKRSTIQTDTTQMTFSGATMFPSKQGYDVNDTHTYLETGYYVLCELDPPKGHTLNRTVVPIEVTDQSIFADAGNDQDGIRVGKYAAMPLGTMVRFAAEDALDGTLTYLKTHLTVAGGAPDPGSDAVIGAFKPTTEGNPSYTLKYDNGLGRYQRLLAEDGSAMYMNEADSLHQFTSIGHPVLQVYQDDRTEEGAKYYTMSLKSNFDGGRTGKVVLEMEGDGSTSKRVINMNDGIAGYRLEKGQTVKTYTYIPDGKNPRQLTREIPGKNEKGDFVLSEPNMEKVEGDISTLFSISTLIQVHDLDFGTVTVEKQVEEPENGELPETIENTPFYFRFYARYENVTEVHLFDLATRELSTYSGLLNARIGPAELGVDENGQYDETEVRNISLRFENGVAKTYLPEGFAIKRVYIPEEKDHEAAGTVAFIPHRITLRGDKADFNGSLYVGAKRIATGAALEPKEIKFTNGVGIYYTPNAAEITTVSTDKSATGEIKFQATSRYSTATGKELFSEAPQRKIPVKFTTDGKEDGADRIIYGKDKGVDVTFENGQYYMNAEDGEANTEFLQGAVLVGDFALYPGQSITTPGIPSGMTFYAQEWSVGEESKDAYDELRGNYTASVTTRKDDTDFIDRSAQYAASSVARVSAAKKIIFTNTPQNRTTPPPPPPEVGSLEIEKRVVGATDPKETFVFRVELSDKTITGKFGEVEFANGVATVKLGHEGKVEITDLPAGTTYTITEQQADGYTTTYADGKVEGATYPKDGVTGTIDKDKTAHVTFTNTRQTGSLTVEKVVAGVTDPKETFEFQITLSDKAITGKYGEVEFTKGVATVKLGHNDKVEITGLPAGTKYTITEQQADGYTTTYADGKVEGAAYPKDGVTGTIETDETAHVTFTNTRQTGSLTVEKVVAGNMGDRERAFTFRVELDDKAITGEYGDVTFENGVATFSLSDGGKKTIENLPAGVQYTITETQADGYTTTYAVGKVDPTEYDPDNGVTGEIKTDEPAHVTFTNTRQTGSLTVEKVVKGNMGDRSKQFTFQIKLDPALDGTFGDVTFKKGVATVELKHKGKVEITGLPAGTKYTITEERADGYTTTYADGKVKDAAYTENGVTGTIDKDKTAHVTFTNTRQTGSLTVEKVVKGNMGDRSKQFTFQIKLSDKTITGEYGEVEFTNGVATVKLRHKDKVTITGLPAGTTYTITEQQADGYTTTYAVGKVEDAAYPKEGVSGTIAANVTAHVTFTNTRQTGSLTVEKVVAGNMGDRSKQFEFQIKLDPALDGTFDGVTFEKGVATVKLKHNDKVEITGLPAGVQYTITEERADGYTTTYAVGEVKDAAYTENGVSGTIAANATARVQFTNRYEVELDMGVRLDKLPYLLLLGIVAAGLGLLLIGRRRAYHGRH